ncbi:SDR family NAD(P)-dependent oxidoreductase [Cryptosporangium aurantiacum]|uniref:Short chain dehydrogenase n=1 Tax=Cryptosporangium aurantiacum TaxID=134849 RepID=A0A1M7PEC8_9ACTN|nr:SDR family NAD(P)-dependent oxidoreductase [Cryptosporangium aurantiacum]SHN15327.1 short chain dehydrogenase [Cryptosporangium aurantiacum]
MPTIAIVGAGPGLGLAIAQVFGRQGFGVALLSRSQEKLDGLVAQLGEAGIEAAGFAADVLDRPSLTAALAAATERFGSIDVLEYSPAPHTASPTLAMADVLDVTPENLQPQLDYYLYGAVTAANAVLPAMLAAGAGTLLFTTGAGSVTPLAMMGNVNAAAAALRNWVLNLHGALADKGIYAAHVPINAWIGSGAPSTDAATIAQTYWDLYTARQEAEHLYTA